MAGTHSVWIGALLLVGCGFEAPPREEEEMGTDIPGQDDPSVPRTCTQGDDSLRLCIDFEDMGTLAGDGSGRGHHPVLAVGLTTTNRNAEHAVQMAAQSRLQIAEHADLDIATNLTVSMWMKNEVRPTSGGGAFWMLDNNNQYAMSLQPDGQVRCGLGTDTVDSLASLSTDSWHHVACSFDGNKLKVHIDGWTAGCRTISRPIATTGIEGLAIGSNINAGPSFTGNYVGQLDNVQVFARTWTTGELCDAASNEDCLDICLSANASGEDDD